MADAAVESITPEQLGDEALDLVDADEAGGGEDDVFADVEFEEDGPDVVAQIGAEARGEDPDADVDDEVDGEPSGEAEASQGQPRSQKRIEALVEERNELKAELKQTVDQTRQQVWQLQQQIQEQQANFQQQMLQLEQQRLYEQQIERQRISEENMSELDRFKLKTIREAEQQIGSRYDQRFNELNQKIAQQEAERRQHQEAIARQRRFEYFGNQSRDVLNESFRDFDPEDRAVLDKDGQEMLLAMSAAYGKEPKEVSARFKQFLDRYSAAQLKRRTSAGKKKTAAAKKAVSPAQGRRRGGTQKPKSLEEIQAAGFDDPLEAMMRGNDLDAP